MKRIILKGGHLAGGKPEYPPYCVVCGKPCDSSMFIPVSTPNGGLKDLLRAGEGHFVPVHEGTICKRKLQREYFRDRRLPIVLMFAYTTAWLTAALVLGEEWLFYGSVAWLPLIIVATWLQRGTTTVFEARLAIDDRGAGLLVCEFANHDYAARFAEANKAALAASGIENMASG